MTGATGFYVWEDCSDWNAGKSGPIPILLYSASWSDGSTTYYQYYNGKRYDVLQGGGNYYLTMTGDIWGQGGALFEADAIDPAYGAPPQPAYACSGFNH
ncbi:hypothetical protein [Paraburkholderia youngii]|uniref:hypothetical protein n=1 Tax=Paraburkholderia youngii TaxID=2782701 RepID=UPI003D1E3AC7